MMSLSGKPLGTDNYDFYAHQYQLCNIDSPVILAQNCCGKRIIIPRSECSFKNLCQEEYLPSKHWREHLFVIFPIKIPIKLCK